MKNNHLTLATGRVRYLDNQGDGPVLLFCHGNSSAAEAFAAQFAALSERYRLIALDFPGHGGSPPAEDPQQAYSFAGFAQTLVEFVEGLGLDRYCLIGHSLGGHAALEALPRLPGLSALILVAAPPFNSASAAQTFLPDPSEGLVFQANLQLNQVNRLARAFVQAAHLPSPLLAQVEAFIHAADPQVRSQLGNSLAAGDFADECQLLRDSGVPALLLQGTADGFIDWRYCVDPGSFPGCDLEVGLFEECGHNPHVEQPTRFNDLLDHFVAHILRKAA
ncbi:MAG: alpha/beta hydrolase [Pseudomonas sp.]|uniref:alpha/beta fold hydrolase n=1 Tax=Pseudomonas sp. TaxID=306 RepID=UPI00339619DE